MPFGQLALQVSALVKTNPNGNGGGARVTEPVWFFDDALSRWRWDWARSERGLDVDGPEHSRSEPDEPGIREPEHGGLSARGLARALDRQASRPGELQDR